MVDMINGKTPDEIKKWLEICPKNRGCDQCPYNEQSCADSLLQDASAYIRQLQYALLLMIEQYCAEPDGTVFHRFMSAGEHAFEVLGIQNFASEENLEIMIQQLEKEMKG